MQRSFSLVIASVASFNALLALRMCAGNSNLLLVQTEKNKSHGSVCDSKFGKPFPDKLATHTEIKENVAAVKLLPITKSGRKRRGRIVLS